ncbi:glycoside hydrolase family 9 protein [Parvularcula marina]|nr:glycoside hydrolase family 9 protein [Parvularcula marina]
MAFRHFAAPAAGFILVTACGGKEEVAQPDPVETEMAETVAPAETNAPLADDILTEAGYFSEPGLDVLVFSNWYDSLFSDAKISGVEIIHHGVRVVTNGDVRLSPTPGQWEPIGSFAERDVDREGGVITAELSYQDFGFDYRITGRRDGEGYLIRVESDEPLPAELDGVAGFNLEFIPSVYGGAGMLVDGKAELLPVYPTSEMELREDGPRPDGAAAEPLPLAEGREIVMAAGDERAQVTVRSTGTPIAVYDGRNQAQNGWFVLRSLLPADKTGTLVEWRISAPVDQSWMREPVVSYNQLGYRPSRDKVAIIELDARSDGAGEMKLIRLGADGETVVKSGTPEAWGHFLRYQYASFDFSEVTEPGLYTLEYEGRREGPFRIGEDAYDRAWQSTLDIFFPVQMDHMFVNEGYRVWHGAPHLDDALQAPVDHEHHDLYRQGATTDTAFAPLEHIPGLNVGGWFDAGDYDIRTQSQYGTVRYLVMAWDDFRLTRDQTKVDWARRRTDIHVPDGEADLQQQIAHGTKQLFAQFDAVGFAIHGIVEPDLDQYTHLGDALTKTDNLIHDARLGPDDKSGGYSGKLDDRWAFTSRASALQYGSAAGLAAAARALKTYDEALAEKALATAIRVFDDEESREPDLFQHGNTTGGPLPLERFRAAAELLLTTEDPKYAGAVFEAWEEAQPFFGAIAPLAIDIRPLMSEGYDAQLREAAEAYIAERAEARAESPFNVEITKRGWAGAGAVVGQAVADYKLHTAFPDLVPAQQVFDGFDYVLGRHPGHNLSLVSGIGAKSKKVAYGTNRADHSYIAGGVVPGMLILKPDYPENREDWPFFWGQNEYVIPLAAQYIYLANAAARLGREE